MHTLLYEYCSDKREGEQWVRRLLNSSSACETLLLEEEHISFARKKLLLEDEQTSFAGETFLQVEEPISSACETLLRAEEHIFPDPNFKLYLYIYLITHDSDTLHQNHDNEIHNMSIYLS